MSQPTRIHVRVADRPLTCLVCANDGFYEREVKLVTGGMAFMDLEWANKSAVGVICTRCGFVHTFLDGVLTWQTAAEARQTRDE